VLLAPHAGGYDIYGQAPAKDLFWYIYREQGTGLMAANAVL